ncbi:MAG: 50S ribosomal protein L27 [Candidatus Absconditabacterales bacterium]
MAHKKAGGSAKNLRDSKPKYRGVKKFGGQQVLAGNIIIRQKGSKYECGKNTYMGKDFTIHAKIDGVVAFRKKKLASFNGKKYLKTVVDTK